MRLAAAVTSVTPEQWFGMTLQPVTDVMRRSLGVPGTGAIVSDVSPDGPAQSAGLQVGDLLQELNGKTIKQPADVASVLVNLSPDDVVKTLVWRKGKRLKGELRVGNKPKQVAQKPPSLPEAEIEIEAAWLGLDIVPLTPAEAEDLGIDEDVRGMLVDDVAAGRGVDAGLAAGDVILAINGKLTRTTDEFKQATAEAPGALLDVLRGGRHIYISVPPPGTSVAERRAMEQRLGLRAVAWNGYAPQPARIDGTQMYASPPAPAAQAVQPAPGAQNALPAWGDLLVPPLQRVAGTPSAPNNAGW
jgi:S1-C subfamily serine protease